MASEHQLPTGLPYQQKKNSCSTGFYPGFNFEINGSERDQIKMFTKLQFYILGGCILAAAIVFSVCEFWQKTPTQKLASAFPSSTDGGNARDQPANEEATNPASQGELQTQSSPSVAKADISDDKAIDAVMEKLEHDFLANDYSYTFEVMYAPCWNRLEAGKRVLRLPRPSKHK